MNVAKSKGPIIEQGLCRCCGTIKRCRILNLEYEWQGQKEVYSDMFMDCFGLLLSHLEGTEFERVICATCVTRLRDATAFKHQVLQCENNLLKTRIQVHGEDGAKMDLKTEVKVEVVEAVDVNVLSEMDNDDRHSNGPSDGSDCDYEPETKVKARKSSRKRLAKAKVKSHIKREYLKKKKELQKKLKVERETRVIENEKYLPRPKIVEPDMKGYINTITIVENSYVCPFYTSFSDYYCVYCKTIYTDPVKLRDHTLEHDPTSFKDFLYDSKKLAQIDVLRIDCRLCPERINDIDVLKVHLETVHEKLVYPVQNEFLKFKLTANPLVCMECGRSFKFFHALKKHMAEHFGTCICDVCGAHYFEERILAIHQRKHQENNVTIHSCSFCDKAFKSKHNRNLHEAKVHKKEAAYPCSKCDEVFFTYTLRYRHLIETHNEERKYPCDVCGRVYDSRKSLREHNRRSHLKIMKHECDLCDRRFYLPSRQASAVTEKHNEERKYPCDVCGRVYDSRKSLREHNRRSHLKIVKHECDLCDRRFYLPSRLKEHMSTHTGERNYRCEYCGKSYPRLRGLKVHMQSHSTDKKFRCLVCNAAFTQNVNLKNHMKRQHQTYDMEEGDYHAEMMMTVK